MNGVKRISQMPWGQQALLLVFSILVLAGITLTAPGEALGQEGSSRSTWSVQPASKDGPDARPNYTMTLKPGDVVTDYVNVSNLGTEPLTLAVYASDAFNTPQGGFDLLPADQEPVDVGTWVSFASPTVTIPGRESVVVPFTLTVPMNATPGDHVGGIVASRSRPGQDGSGNQVMVDYRVGARVYLRVEGQLAPSLEIEQLDVEYTSSFNPMSGGEMTVSYSVRNTGNARLTGSQQVEISGPLGVSLKSVPLNDLPELLPGAVHDGVVTIEGVQPAGRISTTLNIAPAVLGEGATTPVAIVSSSQSLWAPPVTIGAVALGVVALGAIKVRGLRKTSG